MVASRSCSVVTASPTAVGGRFGGGPRSSLTIVTLPGPPTGCTAGSAKGTNSAVNLTENDSSNSTAVSPLILTWRTVDVAPGTITARPTSHAGLGSGGDPTTLQ